VEAPGFDDAAGAVGVEALGSSPDRYGFAVINGSSISVFRSVVTDGAVVAEADTDVVDIGVVLAEDEAAMALNLDKCLRRARSSGLDHLRGSDCRIPIEGRRRSMAMCGNMYEKIKLSLSARAKRGEIGPTRARVALTDS
jgi:hypothetical protein